MKHLLIAVYIFSVLYCYLQLNIMIDRCVNLFKERHPTVLMDAPVGLKEFKLALELLGISAVPVINLFLGYFLSTLDKSVILEIVNNVEEKHRQEIIDAEKNVNKSDDLDNCF